jgi:hypothetical protein
MTVTILMTVVLILIACNALITSKLSRICREEAALRHRSRRYITRAYAALRAIDCKSEEEQQLADELQAFASQLYDEGLV